MSVYLMPIKGLEILDPALGDHLPEEGREVAETAYWYRRLRDKSVVLGTNPKRAREGPQEGPAKESQADGAVLAPLGEVPVPAPLGEAEPAAKKTKKK
jgi:hypothetical protein